MTLSNGWFLDSLMLKILSTSNVSSSISFSMFFFSITLIASSSSESSYTRGDVLDGGGVSSNVTLSDSLELLLLPKRACFINAIIVIRKDDEFRETSTIESDTAEDNDRDIIVEGKKETDEGLDSSKLVIEVDESRDIKRNNPDDRTCGETKEVEEVKEESEELEEGTEEEGEDEPKYFDTFPIIKELVKDTTSVIDHCLRGMVLGKPFVKETGLVYSKENGTFMFEKDKKKIIFKMPHNMERFNT
nr:hypothetical protein [Tanacetum cinerariifolium]